MLIQSKSVYTGNRVYIDEKTGIKYPSASTIAGHFWSSYGLWLWRVNLGREIAADMEDGHLLTDKELAILGYPEADRIKEESATRGSCVHDAIEHEKETTGDSEYDRYLSQYYNHVAPYLEILYNEITLSYTTPDNLRFAGKADIIGFWKDHLAICDMKTSEHLKETCYMGRFALQLAQYALGLEQRYDRYTDLGVIFNLTPSAVHIFRIPLEEPKRILLDEVLPAFYDFYRLPERERPDYPNQFRKMGNRLAKFERGLTRSIEIDI